MVKALLHPLFLNVCHFCLHFSIAHIFFPLDCFIVYSVLLKSFLSRAFCLFIAFIFNYVLSSITLYLPLFAFSPTQIGRVGNISKYSHSHTLQRFSYTIISILISLFLFFYIIAHSNLILCDALLPFAQKKQCI